MVGGGFHNQVSGHMKSEDIKNVVQHANMLGHHFLSPMTTLMVQTTCTK